MAEKHATGMPKYLSLIADRLIETAIWTFAELGIADLLEAADKPQTADELAEKQGWNSDCLYRLLRTVVDADIVREIKSDQVADLEKTNRFELTEDGRFLTSNHPSNIRDLLRWELSPIAKQTSHYLPNLIRDGPSKGTGLKYATGSSSFFDYLHQEENKDIARIFNNAMTSYSTYSSQPIVDAIDLSRFDTIVDIGGGLGLLLAKILATYSTIKQGICFDLSNVIQQAATGNELEKQNIPKTRYQFVAGDMFDAKTIPQADAYIMKSVIHDWTDERALEIFKSIRTAANGKSITLFLADLVVLSDIEQNRFVNRVIHGIDIHMMVLADAKERTQYQLEYLLKQSGFEFKQLHRTQTPYSIIEAVAN